MKESERELAERVRQMQQQLEVEAENLAVARQNFNDERVAWEMENRDYADVSLLRFQISSMNSSFLTCFISLCTSDFQVFYHSIQYAISRTHVSTGGVCYLH